MNKLVDSYANLSQQQKSIFDSYIENRSISGVARELGLNKGIVHRQFNSAVFQLALTDFNKQLADKVTYNAATIIDKLWFEYSDPDTPKAVKVQILIHLGKYIGMWNTNNNDKGPATVQYNIVNYNNLTNEIDKNKDAIDVELSKEPDDTPEGVELLTFS